MFVTRRITFSRHVVRRIRAVMKIKKIAFDEAVNFLLERVGTPDFPIRTTEAKKFGEKVGTPEIALKNANAHSLTQRVGTPERKEYHD